MTVDTQTHQEYVTPESDPFGKIGLLMDYVNSFCDVNHLEMPDVQTALDCSDKLDMKVCMYAPGRIRVTMVFEDERNPDFADIFYDANEYVHNWFIKSWTHNHVQYFNKKNKTAYLVGVPDDELANAN